MNKYKKLPEAKAKASFLDDDEVTHADENITVLTRVSGAKNVFNP